MEVCYYFLGVLIAHKKPKIYDPAYSPVYLQEPSLTKTLNLDIHSIRTPKIPHMIMP